VSESRGRVPFFAGRIANPPWGALLLCRIRNPAGFETFAPILKRTLRAMRLTKAADADMISDARD